MNQNNNYKNVNLISLLKADIQLMIFLVALVILPVMASAFVPDSSVGPHVEKHNKAVKKQPVNIILITADDLGMQLGCYGDTIARTPYLDQFAKEGLLFKKAHVAQASCSPSRSAILTGLYPHQNGQVGLSQKNWFSMHASVKTLPAMLKESGYRTGIIGKLHIEPNAAFPFDFANHNTEGTRDIKNLAEMADQFINNSDQPFFLMVNFFDPHEPFLRQVKGIPEKPFEAKDVKPFPFQGMNTTPIREHIAQYYNCVTRMDAGVGLLLQKLAQSGKADNTLVIFISDNGPAFSRAKMTCYDAGTHVPMIIRYPGQRLKGTADALVSAVDITPTILECAGTKTPAGLAGKSLLPLLNGKQQKLRDFLFTEHTAHNWGLFFPRRSVTDGRYHLIVNLLPGRINRALSAKEDSSWNTSRQPMYEGTAIRKAFDVLRQPPELELYDLEKDPIEFHNLADQPEYQAILKKLREKLDDWRKETNDPLLDSALLQAMAKEQEAPFKRAN